MAVREEVVTVRPRRIWFRRAQRLHAQGRLWDGTPKKNELTVGVRWDFGY